MGFKEKARKHREERGQIKEKKSRGKVEGAMKCGITECENWADKNLGGRSLSIQDVQDIWGEGTFEERKGRVRVCKPCYRTWKKETKDDMEY